MWFGFSCFGGDKRDQTADLSGGDHAVIRELERLADKAESPETRCAIEKAIKMQSGEY